MSKRELTPAEQATARARWREKAISDAKKNGYEVCTEDAVTGAIGFIRTGPKPPAREEPAAMDGCALIVVLAFLAMVVYFALL